MKIYYAHSFPHRKGATDRDATEKEKQILSAIKKKWPDAEIVDPADRKYQKLGRKKNGMSFWKKLASESDIVVAVPFGDRKYGSGVYQEMVAAKRNGSKIYTVNKNNVFVRRKRLSSVEPLSSYETGKRNTAKFNRQKAQKARKRRSKK